MAGIKNYLHTVLSVFRTNQLFNGILLLFYAIALRSAIYIFPELRLPVVNDGGFYTNWVISFLGSGFWAAEIFTVLLLFIQAFSVSFIIYEFRLAKEVSLYAGVFYLLICSGAQWLLPISGVVIGNTFLIFSIYALLKTYRVPSCADRIFNVGFWISISTLFELSNVVFVVFAVFGLNFMRALRLKEILTIIVGFLTPYLLLGVYHFWFDQYGVFTQSHFGSYLDLSFFTVVSNQWINVVVGFFGLLIAYHSVFSNEYFKKKNIQVQKRVSVFFLFMLVSFFTIFFQASTDVTNLLVLAIPLSIFTGFAFIEMKATTATSLHWIWLVLILVLQFRPIIFG